MDGHEQEWPKAFTTLSFLEWEKQRQEWAVEVGVGSDKAEDGQGENKQVFTPWWSRSRSEQDDGQGP